MNLRAAVAGILLSSLALIVLPTPVPAQIVSQVVFLPQTYYIGDRVEARVVLRDVSVEEITIPDQLPTTPAVTIDSVSTVQRADGVEVRFVFQPFFTGTRELPPIDLDGVTVSGVSAFVTSVAGPGEELELVSVRDQLILPGTQLQLAFAMAALIGVPTVVIVAGGWGRRRLSGIRRWYRDVDEELRTRIVELFRFGDLVKFARQRVTLEQRTVHVTEVRAVVDALQRHKPDGESAS
jgi:hypothetical protein